MATAFKLLDTPLPSPPRPAVRVVFDAATQALADHVAVLPERMATLDELPLVDMAKATIAIARRDLSPAMFDAFLTWGERGIMANTSYPGEPDEIFDERVDAGSWGLIGVLDAVSSNRADAAIKLYAAACERDSRASDVGPVGFPDGFDWGYNSNDGLPEAVLSDLLAESECARSLNDLLVQAWQVNGTRMSFKPIVGELVAHTFRDAPRSFPGGLTPDFHQLLDKATEAERLANEYSETVYRPARSQYEALVVSADPADFEAATEAARASTNINEAVDRENELSNASILALDALIGRAPVTVAEFETQCRLNEEREAEYGSVLLGHARTLLAAAAPVELAWNATMAQWRAAGEAERTYQADVYKPAWDALDLATPAVDLNFTDEARSGTIGHFRVDPKRPDAWSHHPSLKVKADAILAAHNRRVEAESEPEFAAICEEYDRLGEVTFDRRNDLLDMPAPTHAALLWKLEQLIGNDNRDIDGMGLSWCAKVCDTVIADARRLLTGVAR